MSITLLFGCCQIETCAPDLDVARSFLVDVVGGVPAEQELARQIAALIPGDAYDVDHIDCGGAIFQINRPSPDMAYKGNPSVHQRYLDEQGPCVTNLNYFVDDIGHARSLLHAMGAPILIEGPSCAARALADYGPDNTRAGARERPFLFMGTRSLIGLDLEIMEPNFLHVSRQSVQFPAFTEPRPSSAAGDLVLHRLVIAVPDLQALLDNVRSIFAPASRSKPYALRQGRNGESLRLGLGGIEIEFCQPQGPDSELARRLAETGPGVVAIAFGAANPSLVIDRGSAAGFAIRQTRTDGIGASVPQRLWHIASRAAVGFDTLIEGPEAPLRA